jgi:hypothetical protein
MTGKTSLYGGFVKGRATPLKFASNNPAFDGLSLAEADARAKLAAHATKGIKTEPKIDSPARKVARQPGRRVNGATRIKGGAV